MKERGSMPYDVVAYEADERAKLLTLEEEGCFHRLLRHAWLNGSIPEDVESLAGICRVQIRTMRKCWISVAGLWTEKEGMRKRLVNKKQESERNYISAVREKARNSARKRWEIKEIVDAKAMRNGCEGNASPLSSPFPIPLLKDSSSPENISIGKPARGAGKTRCPDQIEVTDQDREWAKKNHITVDLIAVTETMIDWAHGKGELRADWLATRHNFWRTEQQRQNNGANNGYKTKAQRIDETSRRLLHQLDQQNSGGGGSGDHGLYGTGLPRAPEKTRR